MIMFRYLLRKSKITKLPSTLMQILQILRWTKTVEQKKFLVD